MELQSPSQRRHPSPKPSPRYLLLLSYLQFDERTDAVDVKIRKLDAELTRYKDQLARLPPGPAKESVKSHAMRVLQQKKMYEQQRGAMMTQSFNMEQAAFATESLKSNADTVAAMQATAKQMRKAYKDISLDKVEDAQDELAEMMAESAEVQEILGRSYGTPTDIDDADLEAELAGLGELQDVEDTSYLDALPPSTSTGVLEASKKKSESPMTNQY